MKKYYFYLLIGCMFNLYSCGLITNTKDISVFKSGYYYYDEKDRRYCVFIYTEKDTAQKDFTTFIENGYMNKPPDRERQTT